MTTVLCWDIDGTLLTTKRAGIFALEAAATEVTGSSVDFQNLPTAGLTDRQIAINILKAAGMPPESHQIDRLLNLYASYLPGSLPRRQGHVLPGVREILDILKDYSQVVSILLTGNIAAGAKAKLSHYGLDDYFTHGAFADQSEARGAIAQQALHLAQDLVGEVDLERVYVIGDTPHDILCAQAIQAKAIAVASGSYSEAELSPYNPWWLIPNLPPPELFIEKLGI